MSEKYIPKKIVPATKEELKVYANELLKQGYSGTILNKLSK
jgi:hypothetical protein